MGVSPGGATGSTCRPLYVRGMAMIPVNHQARQTESPLAYEAVPEPASPRLRPGQSPYSRSDPDRIGKAGPRRDFPTPPRDLAMTSPAAFVGIDVAKAQ